MSAVAAITIGQAPRADLVTELQPILGSGTTIVEAGALDSYAPNDVRALAPATTGHVLVTRLRDGSSITIGEDFLVPRVQACIDAAEDRVDLIILLCTGSFPALRSSRPVLFPEQTLYNMVRSAGARRIGVLTPAAEQRAFQIERWSRVVQEVAVEVASPYGDPREIEAAIDRIAAERVALVVLDCIGYTSAMKRLARQRVERPVVLAISAVARVAAELVGSG